MNNPEIILTVNLDGTSEVEVINGEGKGCSDLTQALEQTLGTVEHRQFKPEYRKQAQTHNRLKTRQ